MKKMLNKICTENDTKTVFHSLQYNHFQNEISPKYTLEIRISDEIKPSSLIKGRKLEKCTIPTFKSIILLLVCICKNISKKYELLTNYLLYVE